MPRDRSNGADADLARHPGVAALLAAAPGISPDDAIRLKARALVDEMVNQVEWEGPPFDVAAVASYCGFEVRYADGFKATQEACITPRQITVNRAKPRRRQRYSISHEIVHTLVPGYREELARGSPLWRDESPAAPVDAAERELERLCQVGAAEILLPFFAFEPRLIERGLTLQTVISLSDLFDASTEATARRALDVTSEPAALAFLVPYDRNGRAYAPGDYTPYAELRVSRSYASASCVGMSLSPGDRPARTSIAWKAWKRAAFRAVAADVYSADEAWDHTDGSRPGVAPRKCRVEAMVLPHRAASPVEVLLLLRPTA